jgi:hypothetical protein
MDGKWAAMFEFSIIILLVRSELKLQLIKEGLYDAILLNRILSISYFPLISISQLAHIL